MRRTLVHMPGAALRVIACAPLCALALAACTPELTLQTAQPATSSRASIVAEPVGGAPVPPSTPVVVRAVDGLLSSVVVRGPDGPLPGAVAPDGMTWTSQTDGLGFGATYTVQATAIDVRGVQATATSAFTTMEPSRFVRAEVVSPAAGSTVGVGTPIVVRFDRPVRRRADVERALVVHTPMPVLGAWAWRDDSTAEFRPKEYWPGGMPVRVELDLEGVQTGREAVGQGRSSVEFTLGPSMVTRVNAQTHTADVFRDGERVRTIPITTGKAGFETRSGVKVITTKEPTRVMDAATGGTDPGDPEYYRLLVRYAMRVTDSGEFVHAAPWSVYAQGRQNVSHGCIGMSTSDAEWLFGQSTVGDIVEVVGTGREQDLGNGITVWNESWEDWLTRSAAGPVITAVDAPAPPGPQADAPGEAPAEAPAEPVAFVTP